MKTNATVLWNRLSPLFACALALLLLSMAGCADETPTSTSGRVDTGQPDTGLGDISSPASCSDGVLNGEETDIDCGGPECPACDVGSVCQSARDCGNGVCRQGVCAPSNCDDGILNGAETDVDCGGECGPCGTGRSCGNDADCVSGDCQDGTCYLPTCDDVQCEAQEACYRGTCYPACESGEPTSICSDQSRCFEGHCAPFECDGVPCHAEESCVRGVCYPPCGDSNEAPCPAIDILTEAPGQLQADSARLRATLIELPIEPVTDHGFCWHTSTEPSHQRGECNSAGEAETLGAFGHDIDGLHAGRNYYVRAFAIHQGDTYYANEIVFTTAAPAPTGVTASQGTSTSYVEVRWLPNAAATGYVVYRDAQEIATIGESTFLHQDAGAGPSSGPGTPVDVSATRGDHTDRVEITWTTTSANDNAPRHDYYVVAVYPDASSPPSEPAVGHRGASPILAYELQVDDGVWFDVGLDTQYADTGAAAGEIEAGTASASAGEHADRVALELSGASATRGVSAAYRVRAINAQGEGPASDQVTGYRGIGSLSYQWQRSGDDSNAGFGELMGATTATYDDTSAPNDGSGRYYRVQVSAEGALPRNSVAARGFRAVAPTVATDTVSNIAASSATLHGVLASLGTPTATVHGFCWGTSPSPSTGDPQGTTCHNLGAPSQTGAFTHNVSALAPGSTYYARAYVTNTAGTFYGDDISFVTPPASPTGVSATNGTFPNFVRVTWNAAAGANQYRVLRDGVLIDTVSVTTFDDTGAGAGGLHQAPSVTATSGDHTDKVALAWGAPTAANGSTHTYTIVAVRDGVAGNESTSDTGYRSAYPILNYELEIDGGSWASIGAGLNYDDTSAPAGTLESGTAAATDGEHAAHVALTLTGTSATSGTQRSYRVRAVSAAGLGAPSATAAGHRGIGAVSIQWQRSASDSDASYNNLAGATAATFQDSDAPADGSGRYYQAIVTADGAAPQTSNAARGFRAALPAVETQEPNNAGGAQVTLIGTINDLGAPDPHAHGFCWGTSLNPDVAETGDTQCEDLGSTSVLGNFSYILTNASANTPYYVRAFATTNAGTVYGVNRTFEIEWEGIRTFSNCSQAGRTGPSQTQCNTAYNGTTLAGAVNVSGGIQTWTVPTTGTYRIEAWGAQGGGNAGGLGARVRGDFTLQAGQQIRILVGQRGATGGTRQWTHGGGGGTFVVTNNDQPLVVAGGGGGASIVHSDERHGSAGQTGRDGRCFDGYADSCDYSNVTNADITRSLGGAFQIDGGIAGRRGTGGAGFQSNGQVGQGGASGLAPASFLSGGAGSAGDSADGGFGGGGGAYQSGYDGAGGGGGYSGGGGATDRNNNNNHQGGGGGSFNSGSNTSGENGARQGHGLVTIDLL